MNVPGKRCRYSSALHGLAFGSVLLGASSAIADGPQSDDFDRHNLNPGLWTFINPLGDGTTRMVGANSGDAVLELSVPAGMSHDPWGVNPTVRAMQAIDNVDFEVEVVFESEPSVAYQMQGIIVEQDAQNWMRIDYYSTGSSLYVFAARTINGSTSTLLNQQVGVGDGAGLRLTRTGNNWTVRYLDNGTTWTTIGSTMSHTMTVAAIGPYVGNYSSSGNAPAFTAVVDYFASTASPPSPEDGGAPADFDAPFLQAIAARATGQDSVEIAWLTDEPSSTSAFVGTTSAYEFGEFVGSTDTYAHAVTVSGLVEGEVYHYQVLSEDAAGNFSASADLQVVFSASGGPTIDVWYGDQQSFGALGIAQPWVNILGNVFDPDGVVSLSYRLNGQASNTLTIGPDGGRLQNFGDFNVDLATDDLLVGQNSVEISATDGLGEVSSRVIQIQFDNQNVWPLPYEIDWGTLGDSTEIADVSWVIDGKWDLTAGPGGRTFVRTTEPGYDRFLGVGDVLWTDYEFEVPIIMHDISGDYGAGVLLRWNGHTNDPIVGGQPLSGWFPLGAILWARPDRIEMYGNHGIILASQSRSLTAGVSYVFKGRVETIPGSGSKYSFKVWAEGQAEPANWDLTAFDHAGDPVHGSLGLLSYRIDTSFGPVSITEVESEPDTTPPVISNIAANPDEIAAVVTWNTDEPANSTVDFGLTSLYGNSRSSGAYVANHSIGLDGLTPGTTYHFRVRSQDLAGNSSTSADMQFVTDEAGVPSLIVTDEFNDPSLNSAVWSILDPMGDSTVAMTGSQASISVPAGVDHDNWTFGIRSTRIVQEVDNTDFEVEIKIDSPTNQSYKSQGFLVEQDAANFLRFETYSTNGGLYMFAAAIHGSSASVKINQQVNLTAPYYMRLRRVGTTWTQHYSDDGIAWTQGGVASGDSLVMNRIGVYSGNAAGSSSPAHTALFDYFRNLDEGEAPLSGSRPACPSDLNVDRAVGVTDLLLLLATWGTAEPGADLNGNGVVDVGDLLFMLGRWGMCPS